MIGGYETTTLLGYPVILSCPTQYSFINSGKRVSITKMLCWLIIQLGHEPTTHFILHGMNIVGITLEKCPVGIYTYKYYKDCGNPPNHSMHAVGLFLHVRQVLDLVPPE